jgi:beta-xylosidase
MGNPSRLTAMTLSVLLAITQLAIAQSSTLPSTRSTVSTQPSWPRAHAGLPEMALHDPWILAHTADRTYYLYTSNVPRLTGVDRSGTMVYKSADLRDWNGPYVVFTIPDGAWADPHRGAWAPEVHEFHGRFYLFTTLHNPAKIINEPPDVWRETYMRGTCIAVADSPSGPFTLTKTDGPIPPSDFMTLDGTLYVDPAGAPWMVYAHEWIQKIDGTMEAVPLSPDLSSTIDKPIYLFKGSDAPWLDEQGTADKKERRYVTDGPELYRSRDGHLLMLWSSYDTNGYVQAQARSKSGTIKGPWEQLPPLVWQDSGHGMLFHTFEGQLMLVLHRPFRNARGKLYEIEDAGDQLRVIRERTDLDGDGTMTNAGR